MRGPRLGAEGAEGKYCLVEEDELLLVDLGKFDQRAHADKQLVVLLLGEVDLLLHALDELELDFILQVKTPKGGH